MSWIFGWNELGVVQRMNEQKVEFFMMQILKKESWIPKKGTKACHVARKNANKWNYLQSNLINTFQVIQRSK